VENEYFAQYRLLYINKPDRILSNNLFPCAKASGASNSSFDVYGLFNNDEEYLTLNNLVESTPG